MSPHTRPGRLVVAPTAIIRFVAGKAFVHAGGPERTHVLDDPSDVALLARFARPADPPDVLAILPPERRVSAAALIRRLASIGALVAAEGGDSPRPGPDLQHDLLAPLAELVQQVAGDVGAYSPDALAAVGAETGVGIRERLASLVAGASALRGELAGRRQRFVDTQLQTLERQDPPQPLRLHVGAGEQRLEGWVNIDAHPAELALDLRWGLPFPDGSASHVFVSHLLEHLYYPEEVDPFLVDLHRVLVPGGRLRVIVPDIEKCLRAYCDDNATFFESRRATWTWWPEARTRLEDFLSYAGAGPRASHFFEGHKFGYDFETLGMALRRAGFSHVIRSGYMESDDPVLRVDHASSVAQATYGDEHYSLFVEVVR